MIQVGAVDDGGSPVTRLLVDSVPAGLHAEGTGATLTVRCPDSCARHAFIVKAENTVGVGPASASTDVVTPLNVLTVFFEPDTQPRDTLFKGSFTLNSTTGSVSGLSGQLTESMTGNIVGSAPYFDMTLVPLTHQLKAWRDEALGGSFVSSFSKDSTSTFATVSGGDGWSPSAGIDNGGVYAGFPAKYPGTIQNASILIFVPDDPFAALTQAQIDKLAYADCAPGGMMGAVCMTGTSVAGYGMVGTMGGYPVSQKITRP